MPNIDPKLKTLMECTFNHRNFHSQPTNAKMNALHNFRKKAMRNGFTELQIHDFLLATIGKPPNSF